MDPTTEPRITPSFIGDIARSAATLCDFFLLDNESQVPVLKLVITVDGKKHKIDIKRGKYKIVLFLLYCAVLKQSVVFDFDANLRDMLEPYLGKAMIYNAQMPETTHRTLRLLVTGTNIQVAITLKGGYDLPQSPRRTLRKLIQHAHRRYDRQCLDQCASAPLIREALEEFVRGSKSGAIQIAGFGSDEWPSVYWQDAVHKLRIWLQVW